MTDAAATRNVAAEPPPRLAFVDVFRGLLMLHMALDHVSLFFNRGRWANELWHRKPPPPESLAQFLTRFTGVFVAPGFSFIAGFMVAVTSDRREGAGAERAAVTRRLVLRGLVLIACEWIVLGLPIGRFGFDVLSCLGACLIVLALVRGLPAPALLAASAAILALHPMLPPAPDSGPLAWLLRLLHDPRELYWNGRRFQALYPVLPWLGVMLLGYVCGRDYLRAPAGAPRRWLLGGLGAAALFVAVRVPAGYGVAWGYGSVASYDFFVWSKYPPDLAWLSWSFMTIFLLLALLARRPDGPLVASAPARFVAVFGRAPLFFYLVHFWVIGFAAIVLLPALRHQLPLAAVWAAWAALALLLAWPCRAWARLRERHPRSMLRYL